MHKLMGEQQARMCLVLRMDANSDKREDKYSACVVHGLSRIIFPPYSDSHAGKGTEVQLRRSECEFISLVFAVPACTVDCLPRRAVSAAAG